MESRQTSIVIGIVGPIRAGKTTVARCLAENHGANVFRNSAPLEHVLVSMGLSRTRENYVKLGSSLFEVLGRDVLARSWLAQIRKLPNRSLCVVDGLRFPEEIELYREQSQFVLLMIDADDRSRYLRSQSASDNHKEQGLSFNEFINQSISSEQESCMDELMAQADERIVNRGSIEDLYAELGLFLNRIRSGK